MDGLYAIGLIASNCTNNLPDFHLPWEVIKFGIRGRPCKGVSPQEHRMSQSVEQPAAEHAAGLHMPKPSFWPLVWGVGFALIAFGIILTIYPLSFVGLGV